MSEKDEKYNGWKNYETWVTALWIDNSQDTYDYSRELVKDCLKKFTPDKGLWSEGNILAADILKEWFDQANPLADVASVWSDLMSAALSEIDWFEIVENFLTEMRGQNESL